jgi:hypothetical protein
VIGNRVVVDVRQTAIVRITAIEAITAALEKLSGSIYVTDNLMIKNLIEKIYLS